jgi:uncharacterized protein (DUF169 family)
MTWKEQAERLKGVLGLKGSPVSVTYSMNPDKRGKKEKSWVCQAFKDARDGEIINISRETSCCMGGTWHLGLGPKPTGEEFKAVQKFLVEGEKLFCSIAVFHRINALSVEPPVGLADYVIFCPMEKAETRPDVVLFICNAEQACRLITLATYYDGLSPRTEMVSSACHMAVSYPLVSGEINVSFLDYTARKMKKYNSDELIVSIPYHKMDNLVNSIDACTAGTARTEFPPEFVKLMEKEGSGEIMDEL